MFVLVFVFVAAAVAVPFSEREHLNGIFAVWGEEEQLVIDVFVSIGNSFSCPKWEHSNGQKYHKHIKTICVYNNFFTE